MKALVCLAAAAAFCAVAAVSASAQDFQKSYSLEPGGRVTVTNMSGNVTIEGYDGSSIVVTATKTGEDVDRVTIEDRSGPGSVEIGVKYPRNCNCNASVDFVVRVPQRTEYRFEKITSMSGDVSIKNVTGAIEATAMSGDVRVGNITGTVAVTSMSGDVDVDIDRLEGAGDLAFTSMSGNVDVRLPSNADLDVSIRTVSGSIHSDFPIEIQTKKYGPGQTATARLGSASRTLRIKSMSGDVRFMRK